MATIKIVYFKTNGKYYMQEDIFIPEKFIENYKNNSILNSDVIFHFRNYLREVATHRDFIGVFETTAETMQAELLCFPLMLMPSNQK